MSVRAIIPEAQFTNTRRHARYRITEKIMVCCANGSAILAMTKDISISGLSISCSELLQLGEVVELDKVAEFRVKAVVRHQTADSYGLEFMEVPSTFTNRIHSMCRGLFRLSHASEERL